MRLASGRVVRVVLFSPRRAPRAGAPARIKRGEGEEEGSKGRWEAGGHLRGERAVRRGVAGAWWASHAPYGELLRRDTAQCSAMYVCVCVCVEVPI